MLENGSKTNLIPAGEVEVSHIPVRARQQKETIVDSKSDVRTVVVVLVALFVGFVCIVRYLNTVSKPTLGESASTEGGGLYSGLRIYDRNPNEPIDLQMSVFNTTPHRINIKFSKDPVVDFLVQRPVNLFFTTVPLEVWRYSASKNDYFYGDGAMVQLLPGEEKIFHAQWKRVDNNGEPVASDKYIITGNINIEGGDRSLLVQRK